MELQLQWETVQLNGMKVLAAKLSAEAVKQLPENGVRSLLVDGRRQVRARWPNANPEKDFFPVGYATGAWGGWADLGNISQLNLTTPMRTKDAGGGNAIGGGNAQEAFDTYLYGSGGAANMWTPPLWSNNSFSFNDNQDYTHKQYAGLVVQPGTGGRSRMHEWELDDDVWVHTLNDGFWGNWMFRVKGVNAQNGAMDFANPITEHGGGWQDQAGAGWQSHCVWFIEGVKAELDSPGEWFYDKRSATLFFIPEDGPAEPSTMAGRKVVVPRLESVIRLAGSPSAPVQGVTFRGLSMQDTLPTFTNRYTIPGPGDWSIYPSGALYLQGTLQVVVEHCVFSNTGGNALYLSQFNRNTTIFENEFFRLGDSAIASVGYADFTDATEGDFPHFTTVERNHIHDIGIYGKQTSGYFQTLSAHNTIRDNVMYNGPRAAINFNDGLGGGNMVEHNLLFNMVRETNDHGAFNSWDRVPFSTHMGDPGDPQKVKPAWNYIHRNFIINYGSAGLGTTGGVWNLDHDDGSAYYEDAFNFLVYAGTKNYLGDNKRMVGNIIIHPDAGLSITPFCHHECSSWFAGDEWRPNPQKPWGEVWANNTCVMMHAGSSPIRFNNVDQGPLLNTVPSLHTNKYYLNGGEHDYVANQGSNVSLDVLQSHGFEAGSVVLPKPPGVAAIITMGRSVLKMRGS